MNEWIVRFTKRQRFEHLGVMLLFTILVASGFPQRFSDQAWARLLVDLCGGLDGARAIHRAAGILFSVLMAIHLVTAGFLVLTGRARPSLVPTRRDFIDSIRQIRYYLGIEEHGARFDRFDYRQKFEYWGLVMGGTVMTSTGFTLYLPILVAKFFPGELIPLAKVVHGNEGMLAFLVVIIWHIFNAHLSPEAFPYDASIFTGKISRKRMLHEHPLELLRIEENDPPASEEGGGAATAVEAARPPEHE